MKTVNHKCPNCNANLKYEPKSKGWNCDYCGSKYTLKDLEKNTEKFKEAAVKKKVVKDNEEMDIYNCSDCGAQIIADKNTAATFCVYCKNTAILKERLTDEFSPSRIIPFFNTKEEAIEAFKSIGKKKWLMPSEFSSPKNIDEISGVYIPFWLYSCKLEGKYTGKGSKVTTWSTADYIYIKTDIYNFERGGEVDFQNIPIDASVRFNDAVMNSIEPFEYKDLTDFNYSYLSGFLAVKYDVESSEAKKISLERAKKTTEEEILKNNAYSSYTLESSDNRVIEENVEYVLLPVWMLNIKHHEKFYTFAMNGQTGKMIGDIPYSKKKAFLLFLVVFIIVFGIVALISYFV